MFRNKRRIAELEKKVKELEVDLYEERHRRELMRECFESRYEDVDKLIEKYVSDHIWYTTQENLQAFKDGGEIKVIMRDFNKVMGKYDA